MSILCRREQLGDHHIKFVLAGEGLTGCHLQQFVQATENIGCWRQVASRRALEYINRSLPLHVFPNILDEGHRPLGLEWDGDEALLGHISGVCCQIRLRHPGDLLAWFVRPPPTGASDSSQAIAQGEEKSRFKQHDDLITPRGQLANPIEVANSVPFYCP